MPSLTPEAIVNLRKIQNRAIAEPRRVHMKTWGKIFNPESTGSKEATLKDFLERFEMTEETLPPCGAVGCIAGNFIFDLAIEKGVLEKYINEGSERDGPFAATQRFFSLMEELLGRKVSWINNSIISGVSELIGITYDQGAALFTFNGWGERNFWPNDFVERYEAATTPEEGAQVIFDRIDLFIETDGTDIRS